MFKWITPSLAVVDGCNWPCEPFSADEATQAVDWIELGHTAYVKDDDAARAVLLRLGLSNADVDDRLRFAYTGRVA